MKTEELVVFLKQKPSASACLEFLGQHCEDLVVAILKQPETQQAVDRMLVCLQFIFYSSQYQSSCTAYAAHVEFSNLVRTLLHRAVQLQTSKLFQFYAGILSNLCIVDEVAQKVADLIRADEVLTIAQAMLKTNNLAGLYFLSNVGRCTTALVSTPVLQEIVRAYQKRDEKLSVPQSQLIRNLFIHIRDHHELQEQCKPVIRPLILELTGEEFYQRFTENLKDFEQDQKDIFVKDKKMHPQQSLFNLVEALILYVRIDKKEVKTLYPQLRELHMYLIDAHGEDELNDAINVLIEHCVSDDPEDAEQPAPALMPASEQKEEEAHVEGGKDVFAPDE